VPSPKRSEPVSDIDTGVVDSLKALDPRRPIREADKDADLQGCPLSAKTGREQMQQTA
jgi:hypothetical protein